MTAPLCIWCKQHLVTRDYHRSRRSRGLGARIIDGLRWHWCCSRACQAAHAGDSQTDAGIRQATIRRREKFEAKLIEQVVAACRSVMDRDGRLSLRDAARLIVRERRIAYLRGYNVCQQRIRRGKAA